MAEEVPKEEPEVNFAERKFGKKPKVGDNGKEGAFSRFLWLVVGAGTFAVVQEIIRRRRGEQWIQLPRGFTTEIKPLALEEAEEIEL